MRYLLLGTIVLCILVSYWLSLYCKLTVNHPCASQCVEHVDRLTCPFSTWREREKKINDVREIRKGTGDYI